MPKIIEKNPAFFVIPALIIIIGAVFLFTDSTRSASEFDREASPAGYTESTMNDVVAHFNDGENVYNVWTVGVTVGGNGLIFDYDGSKFLWSAQEINPGLSLNGIDLYYDSDNNKYTLWAVGNSGYIVKYDKWDDVNYAWGYQCKINRCPGGIPPDPFNPVTDNITTANLVDVSFIDADRGWVISDIGEVFKTPDGGQNWLEAGSVTWRANAIEMIADNNGWIVGEGGNYAHWNGSEWGENSVGAPAPTLTDVSFVSFEGTDYGWAACNSSFYYYYDGTNWSPPKLTNLGVTSNMNGVTAVLSEGGDYHVWFVGDNGRIMFSQDNTNWIFQQTDVTLNLKKAFAVNPTHVWSVGEESMILKISPGNTTGWGYMGADNCDEICKGDACYLRNCPSGEPATKPVGWVSFNCANMGVCDSTTFSYGVNIKKKLEAGQCKEDTSLPCIKDGDCGIYGPCEEFGWCTNNIQDKDVGVFSGYGWFGKSDIYELPPGVACNVKFDGYLHCSNNNSVVCNDVDDCACAYNYASCYSTGWLSFDRNDTGDPPENPYQSFPITTPCLKDILSSDPENYILATFDYDTYVAKGWARFMTGTCTDDLTKACFKDSDCTGNCYHNGQGRCLDDWAILCQNDIDCGVSGSCQYPEGWVKLRGGENVSDPDPSVSDYMPCNACITVDLTPGASAGNLEDDDGDEYITCKICDGFLNGEKYMCNSCGSEEELTCGTGRCSEDVSKVCIIGSGHDYCTDRGPCDIIEGNCISDRSIECSDDFECLGEWGECKVTGYCISGPIFSPCTNNTHCDGTADSCYISENWSGNTCNTCGFCDQYGVSVDINAGDWFGYAYSEDFGWIDMSTVGLYNAAWIRVQYGDIYSRGNIGNWQTTPPPGYNYSTRDCNASYLILAGGRVINFCSDALSVDESVDFGEEPSVETPTLNNPYVVEGYRAFNLPRQKTELFSPHSILGTIDYDYLVRNVKLEDIFEGQADADSFGAGTVDLAGKIYHVEKTGEAEGEEGNLTIDKAGGFKIGSGFTDGSGLVIVDGDLIIESDIIYDDTDISEIKQIPSIGFYVKGDIIVSRDVSQIVGTYYTENSFITLTSGSVNKDIQLKVGGILVAGNFDLRRRFKGTINIPLPAEIITYDGRIQLNPPPGFRDLTSALPKIRQTNP